MEFRKLPTADVPILLFLIAATGVLGMFAGTLYWLQRPHVIDTPVQTAIARQDVLRKAAVYLPTSSAVAVEMAENATRAADEANAELGLKRPLMAAAPEPPPREAMAQAAPKPKAKAKRTAKRQRVEVAEHRSLRKDWRNDWRDDWRNNWRSERRNDWRGDRREAWRSEWRGERRNGWHNEWRSEQRSFGWSGRSGGFFN